MRKIDDNDYLVTIKSGNITDLKNGSCVTQQAVVTGLDAATRAEALLFEKKYNRETDSMSINSVYASPFNTSYTMERVLHVNGNTSAAKNLYGDKFIGARKINDTKLVNGVPVLDLRIGNFNV